MFREQRGELPSYAQSKKIKDILSNCRDVNSMRPASHIYEEQNEYGPPGLATFPPAKKVSKVEAGKPEYGANSPVTIGGKGSKSPVFTPGKKVWSRPGL